ncbi:MAG: hypothetical protein IJ081_06650 [Prevotella sp.]|jgi:hypothetical protein|nr:hypothetical protein [Prevotella sp.]
MYQSDRGNYRKEDSLFKMFWNSCLGKLIILGAILGFLSLIAYLSRPSEQYMQEEMLDNIRQCLERTDSVTTDWMDDAVSDIGYIFTSADSIVDEEKLKNFRRHNRLEFYDHGLYVTMRVYNNFNYNGTCCGIGLFGLVIPVFSSSEFVLRVAPVRRDYKPKSNAEIADSIYLESIFDMTFQDIDDELVEPEP